MKIIADKVSRSGGVYHAYILVKDELSGSVYTSISLDWDPAKETGAQFKARVASTLKPILAGINDVESKRATLQTLLDALDPANL